VDIFIYKLFLYCVLFFLFCFFALAQQSPVGQGVLIYEVSRSHTISTTVGRTPLHGRSAHRSHLHLKTHKTNKRQTSMPPEGFETTISAGERPQTYCLRTRGHWDRLYTMWAIHYLHLVKQSLNTIFICLFLSFFARYSMKVEILVF